MDDSKKNQQGLPRNQQGGMKEIEPLCVLDFYVHESLQRKGEGKRLFEYMLAMERKIPSKVSIDKFTDGSDSSLLIRSFSRVYVRLTSRFPFPTVASVEVESVASKIFSSATTVRLLSW